MFLWFSSLILDENEIEMHDGDTPVEHGNMSQTQRNAFLIVEVIQRRNAPAVGEGMRFVFAPFGLTVAPSPHGGAQHGQVEQNAEENRNRHVDPERQVGRRPERLGESVKVEPLAADRAAVADVHSARRHVHHFVLSVACGSRSPAPTSIIIDGAPQNETGNTLCLARRIQALVI